jgi:Overcoming lysogenization defect protein-like, TOPRIM domain
MQAEDEARGVSGYSFRRANETDAFHQAPLLNASAFGSQARDRGINIALGDESLEELDRVGALRPLLFDRGESGIVYRDEVEYTPWGSYAVSEDDYPRVNAYYSQWQLLYALDAVELGFAKMPLHWLLGEERQLSEVARKWYEGQDAHRRRLDDDWRQLLLVLVRIQNRYYPAIRGTLTKITTTLARDPESGELVDPYQQAVREFDPAAVLDELGLTAEGVKNWHHRLATHGITRDPLQNYHALFRMAPHHERSRLKTEALRAQHAYDAAEMLRRFYYDLTGGELLPVADDMIDLRGGQWKEQFYGHGPRLRYDRHDLQVALRLANLDPHIVHAVVEGETEEVLIRTLIEAMTGSDPSTLGISFSNLEGGGRTRLYTRVLRLAKRSARFPILVADREGDIERDIELLKREGLLSDEGVFLAKTSLEEDNFTVEELLAAAERVATRKCAELHLDAEGVRAVYARQRELVGAKGKGLAEVLLSLARAPEHGSVQITKPELGAELAQLLLDELREAEDENALIERRPILGIVFSIIRVT